MIDILEKLQRGTRRDAKGNWYQSDTDIEAELEIEELREQLEKKMESQSRELHEEIKGLQAEIDHLRAALERIANAYKHDSVAGDIAREALDDE